jgi:hypothetical protein
MEYSESSSFLRGGTAGVFAISYTGESKLVCATMFSVMEALLRFFALLTTAYTAVVESSIMNVFLESGLGFDFMPLGELACFGTNT